MAKNAYKGLTVELDGNVSDFSRALRDAKKEAKGTTSELRELKKALKFDPDNAELLVKAQKNYQTQIKATEKELEILRKKEKEIQESGQAVSTEAWTKLQNDIQRATDKLSRLKREQSDLDFSGPIESARKEVQAAEKDLTRLNKSLKLDPTNTELLASKQEALQRAIEGSAKQAENLRKKAQEIGKENMSSQEWINLQADISDCEAKAKDFEEELKDLARVSDDTTDKMSVGMRDVGEKIQSASQKVASVGDAYTRNITAPILAAGAATMKTAVDIDSSLTDVRKTVDGTEEEYQALKQAAIDFSKVNAVDPSEILSLEALGAQLGFSKDELVKFAEVASGLDIATDMDAETAATEMAQFANKVGDADLEMERYASTIVELGNHTATTESKISAMAQRIASAGHNVGLTEPEILGMAAALSSVGIEAEAGGSSISTLMSNIDKTVALGTDRIKEYADRVGMSTDDFIAALSADDKAFEEFANSNGQSVKELHDEVLNSVGSLKTWAETAGMSADEFATAWKEKPAAAFEAVLTGLADGVERSENLNLMLEDLGITSLRQTESMKSLTNLGGKFGETMELANKGWNEQTALSDEVANRNESLASKFEMLKNRIVAVADQVGGPLADALLDAVDAAEPLFKSLEHGAKAFSAMDKEQQQMIIKAVAAVAAFGPLLSIVGRVGTVAGGAIKTLGSVGSALGGIGKGTEAATRLISGLKGGLIGLGITAAATVAAFAIEKWQEYQKEMKDSADAAMSIADIQAEAAKASDGFAQSIDGATQKTRDYRKSIEDTTQKSKELLEEQADSNRKMIDSFKDLNENSGIAQHYLDIITDLSGKTGLTREEQEKLVIAVEGWNQATGDSLEIIDKENGKLSESTDALMANRDAWIKNQKVKIYEDKYNEALRQQIDAQEELKTATDDLTAAQENYDRRWRTGRKGWTRAGTMSNGSTM